MGKPRDSLSPPVPPSPRRLLPHAFVGALVALSPGAFSTWVYYWLACGGMAYMNGTNVYRGLAMLRTASAALGVGGKRHAD